MCDVISCEICGQKMKAISWRHLSKHNLTLAQYKHQFPHAPTRSDESKKRKKLGGHRANEARKGIPRTDEVKNKIKQSKRLNPTRAWNEGVPLTPAQKIKLSKIKKKQYKSGAISHPRKGAILSNETKHKISTSLSCRTVSSDSVKKRALTMANKKLNGWVKPGKPLTDDHKEKLRRAALLNNKTRVADALDRIAQICNNADITIEKHHNTQWFLLKCEKCNTKFSRTRNAFVPSKLSQQAYRCPTCFPRNTGRSNKEIEMFDFIRTELDCLVIPNDRSKLSGFEIDCFVPSLNVGFEFVGNYWHAEKVSYQGREHLLWKKQYALKQGIQIFFIFEDEWDKKQTLVKSRIRSKLKLIHTKLHARKCVIAPISNRTKDQFLEETHIQGKDVSKFRYGAFIGDTLVGVMTFKKTNFVKGGDGSQFELSRFCTLQNTVVRGLASKMFQYFVKEQSPQEIITYADRRWNSGQVYKQLGFVYQSSTPPSYWYLLDGYQTRVHRSNYMKHLLQQKLQHFDPTKTEWENMQANGYDRIWDCGNTKWIWINPKMF